MKLKLTDAHTPAIDPDGNPIVIHDDNSETPLDLQELLTTVNSLTNRNQHLHQQLKKYDGIDPDQARNSTGSPTNPDSQHLQEHYTAQLQQRDHEIKQRDQQIRQLLVKTAFEASDYLRQQTLLIPDMAYTYFGEHFHVEDHDGKLIPVARIDDKPVMSSSRPGHYATPDEALQHIIARHPARDRMLKAGHPGTPADPAAPHHAPRWRTMTAEQQAAFIDAHGLAAARHLIDADSH